MFTRKQYMNHECTHDQYHAQFAEPYINLVLQRFGYDRLASSLQEDKHLNNIPLRQWDMLATMVRSKETVDKLKECGDYLTLATQVCILKCAARMIVDQNIGK